MNKWRKHRKDIDTICRILSAVFAGAALIVAINSLQIQSEAKPPSEVPSSTETQSEEKPQSEVPPSTETQSK